MWDAWSTEAQYRTEQIRRARGLETDHHQPATLRTRAHRWSRRVAAPERRAGHTR